MEELPPLELVDASGDQSGRSPPFEDLFGGGGGELDWTPAVVSDPINQNYSFLHSCNVIPELWEIDALEPLGKLDVSIRSPPRSSIHVHTRAHPFSQSRGIVDVVIAVQVQDEGAIRHYDACSHQSNHDVVITVNEVAILCHRANHWFGIWRRKHHLRYRW